jgi:hypothetical protein
VRYVASKLLNVRIGPEDERLARELRARGVSISALVRRALRMELQRMTAEPVDTDQLLDDIIARHPAPPGDRRKPIDTTDRLAVRKQIRRRLLAKR